MHGKWLKGIANQACVFQAVNIVGVGMFGGTAKVTTPGTVPAMVPVLKEVESKVPAKLSSTCIAIRWEEPDCHGSPITGYNIEYGDKKVVTVKRITEYVLKDLQPNTTYRLVTHILFWVNEENVENLEHRHVCVFNTHRCPLKRVLNW